MKVFLDVGANTGQSLLAALDRDFDKIVCFEPAPICWPYLEKIADKRTKIERFGLWDRDIRATLYDQGAKGAGQWIKEKRLLNAVDKPITETVCSFRRASTWMRDHVPTGQQIYMKLNCEGAECDILDDLLDSGEFEKISYLMVDFDVRKVMKLKHREAETRARLSAYPSPRVMYCKQVMVGDTHQERIGNWLNLADGTGGVLKV